MFPDLITPASDFEHQLGACVNAMSQDDAIGQILVFERMSGMLHMRHIASADLVDTDVDDYEMVIFDGGNTSGIRGSTCSFRVSASTTSCTKPDPPAPFEGLFLYAAQECGRGAVPFPAGRPITPGPCLPHVRRRCRHAQAVETFEAASTGNRAGRFFLRTYRVRPRHPQGTSPLRAGIPCFSSRSFPMDRSLIKSMMPSLVAGHVPRNVRSFKYRVFDDQPLSSTLGFAIDAQPFDKVVAATDDAIVVKLKPSEFAVLDPNLVTTVPAEGAKVHVQPYARRRFDGLRADTPEVITEKTSDGTPYTITRHILGSAPAKLPIPTPQCMELGQLIEQLEEMPAPIASGASPTCWWMPVPATSPGSIPRPPRSSRPRRRSASRSRPRSSRAG